MNQPMGMPAKLRPGRIWYLVSLLVFAAGVAWLVFGIVSVVNNVDSLQRVPLPRGGTVTLTHSGGYTVYYEGPGAQSGHLQGFHVQVNPASVGAAVASLTQYQANVTYNVGGHMGRAVLVLHVTHPGKFAVIPSRVPPSEVSGDLAFGASIGGSIVRAVAIGVPVMILGFLVGLAVFIIRIARKSSLRRAQQQPPAGYGYGYQGPQPPVA
jgi:hypothetical protein